MDDKAQWNKLGDQKPGIQFITSLLIIILLGTLLFYFFAIIGSLIFSMDFSEIISIPFVKTSLTQVSVLKYYQVTQQVAMFIIPGIIIANLLKKRGESFLRVNRQPKSIHIIMVLLLALFMIPLTSYTGMLNSKLDLPVWLSGVEEWMRTKEAIASDIIALFIRSSGIGELFINIFILAIIPSVAEEIIFRGIFQQLLCGIFKSKHLGIWIAAILFSAIHFQFFGFVPRLILGLSFGYLFFWSGNLWLPVLAHFINNFVPVVMSYFFGWGNLNDNTKEIAGKQVGLPLLAATLCAVIFYYFWTEYKKDQVNGK